MKKILLPILAALILPAIVACSGGKKGDNADSDSVAVEAGAQLSALTSGTFHFVERRHIADPDTVLVVYQTPEGEIWDTNVMRVDSVWSGLTGEGAKNLAVNLSATPQPAWFEASAVLASPTGKTLEEMNSVSYEDAEKEEVKDLLGKIYDTYDTKYFADPLKSNLWKLNNRSETYCAFILDLDDGSDGFYATKADPESIEFLEYDTAQRRVTYSVKATQYQMLNDDYEELANPKPIQSTVIHNTVWLTRDGGVMKASKSGDEGFKFVS